MTELLSKALTKFTSDMQLASDGQGCDRHLLGLYLISQESGLSVPDLFLDPAFAQSGGNGNFVLSTSCIGYWRQYGGDC